jgi:hypothetical protein
LTQSRTSATLPRTPEADPKGRTMDLERWRLLHGDPDDDGGGSDNPHGKGSGDGYPPIGDPDDD